MEPGDEEKTLRDYGRVVLRRKWIVLAAVVLCAAAATALAVAQTPIYASSAEVLVQPRGSDALFQDRSAAQSNSERTIQTEIQVLEGEAVRARVQDDLGLRRRPPPANASAVGATDVISVQVRGSDPADAAILANAYAAAYIDVRREQAVESLLAASAEVQSKIDELQTQIDTLDGDDPRRSVLVGQQATFKQTLDQLQVDAALRTGGATVIKSAEPAADPVEPKPLRTAVLAAVVGLLIGLGAAFALDYLDDAVRTDDDLARISGLPVLATVPVDPPPDNRPVSISRPDDYAVETYRGLRTNLLFLGLDRPIKVVQVTSSSAGEGKTTTAANLAVVLAQAGNRVALVDADLRRPRVHEVFAVPPSPGLTDLLLGDDVELVAQPLDIGGATLEVVTSGAVPTNPGELLTGRRIAEVLAKLAERHDVVVVDSAPVLPVADSIALAASVDAVILVTQAGRTSNDDVRESLGRLQRVGAPVVGLVLNRASKSEAGSGGYGYGYGAAPHDRATTDS
jgi:polysaccharide biosynthesis transport protein